MNPFDILLLGGLGLWAVAALRSMLRRKGGCGCGSCHGCHGCDKGR